MKKDEILNASRKEHRNKDLAEMEQNFRNIRFLGNCETSSQS